MEIIENIISRTNIELFDWIRYLLIFGIFAIFSLNKRKATQFIRKMKFENEPKQEVTGMITNIKLQKDRSGYSGWFFEVEALDPFLHKTRIFKSDVFPMFGGKLKSFFQTNAEDKMKDRLSSILKEGDQAKIYISPIKSKYYYIEDKDLLNKLESLK